MSEEVRARVAAALGTRAFELSRREDRWLALADDLVAFVVDSDAGRRRLALEAWLIDRWRAAGIPTPRVERAEPDLQIRERLHGRSGHDIHTESNASPLFAGALPDVRARLRDAPLSPFGERVAASYGELAARIRSAVTVDEAAAIGFGPTSRQTLDVDEAIARLAAAAPSTRAATARTRDWLAEREPLDAVIHADLHFHNMCVDDSGSITGIFDFGDSGIDAAATELMYVHSLGSRFAKIAIAAYGPIDEVAVERAHLRTALDHVINHGPGTPRHESVIAWASAAFERFA